MKFIIKMILKVLDNNTNVPFVKNKISGIDKI